MGYTLLKFEPPNKFSDYMKPELSITKLENGIMSCLKVFFNIIILKDTTNTWRVDITLPIAKSHLVRRLDALWTLRSVKSHFDTLRSSVHVSHFTPLWKIVGAESRHTLNTSKCEITLRHTSKCKIILHPTLKNCWRGVATHFEHFEVWNHTSTHFEV